MSEPHPQPILSMREDPGLPADPVCAGCRLPLTEPYGWCANCREAFCPDCGHAHYCMPTCPSAGCHPGLCVRLVRAGAILPNSWGMRE